MRDLVDSAFLKFAFVGLATTALDFILFSALTVGAGINAAAANILSYSFGIIVSFTLNRWWTFGRFGSGGPLGRMAVRFAVTHAAGLTLSTVLVFLLALFVPAIAAKIISVPIVFVWNYLLARFWVFGEIR